MSKIRCKDCRFNIERNGIFGACNDYMKKHGWAVSLEYCKEGDNNEKSLFEPILEPGMKVWVRDEIGSENGEFDYTSICFPEDMDKYKDTELILEMYTGRSWKVEGAYRYFHEAWLTTKKPKQEKFHRDFQEDEFLEAFKKGEFKVSCRTEDQAIKFCNWMESQGLRWSSGESYKAFTNWGTYKEDTVYTKGKYFGYFADSRKVINSEDIVYEAVAATEGDITTHYKVWDKAWVRLDAGEVSEKDDNHSVIWLPILNKYLGEQVRIIKEVDKDGDYLVNCSDSEEWHFKNTWLTNEDPNIEDITGKLEEKEFKPFDVTFKIESEKDLKSLWAYLYTDACDLDNTYNWDIHECFSYFVTVDDQVDRLGLK